VEVVAGVSADEGQVFVGYGAADFSGDSGDEGARGDDGVLGDEGTGGDDGAGPDVGVVEDYGSDADEDVVFEDAAVDGGVVADGDSLADGDGVEVALAVDDGAVLYVGAGSDADAVDVAADDGVHPDGAVLAEDYVADDLGGDVHVGGGGDGGVNTLEGTEHGVEFTPGRKCRLATFFVPVLRLAAKVVKNSFGFLR
jgi:hypothetical protein